MEDSPLYRKSFMRELEELVEKFNKTPIQIIKNNLHKECSARYKDFGGRIELAKETGLSLDTFTNYTNKANLQSVKLDVLITICVKVGIDIDNLFNPVGFEVKDTGITKKWTNEKKKEFLKIFTEFGNIVAARRYKIDPKSADIYYLKWKDVDFDESI